VSLRFMWIKRD